MTDRTVIYASDVLSQTNAGLPPLSDSDITADCLGCGKPVLLSSCSIEQGMETTYICAGCKGTLLIIGAPNADGKPWPGRGFRIGDFVLRNAADLHFRGLKVPRSPAALDKTRDQ